MHRCQSWLSASRTRHSVDPLASCTRATTLNKMSGVARVIVGLLSLAALAGCGPSGGSSPTPKPSTTSSPSAIEAAVLQAYRAESAAFVAAVRIPDPSYPGLAQSATNPLLMQVRQSLVYDKDQGIVGRGDVALQHPHVVTLSGSTAVVQDCAYSTLVLVYSSSGQPVPGQPGGAKPEYDGVRSMVDLTAAESWKVSDQSVTAGSCPPGY
jgi:hypothetical protein